LCVTRDAATKGNGARTWTYEVEAARFGKEGAPLFSTTFVDKVTSSTSLRWKAWRKIVEKVSMLFKRDELLHPSGDTNIKTRGQAFKRSWIADEINGLRSSTSQDERNKAWPDRWIPQRWKMFDTDGHWVDSVDMLADDARYIACTHGNEEPGGGKEHALFLVFEGGQFIWPGIEIGFKRPDVAVGEGRKVTITTKSIQPLVLTFDHFLSDEECSNVIVESEPHMDSSGLSMNDRDRKKGSATKKYRTSTTHWLRSDYNERPWLESVDNRVTNITRSTWGTESQEAVQVLRYEEGQYYNGHLDYTERAPYVKNKKSMMDAHGGYKNRMVTVFWYLSDVGVEDGGSTHFPRAGGLRHPTNNRGCEIDKGLHVYPSRGRGMMFYDLLPDGWGDPYSMHTACPIKNGATKWAANKWVRNEPFRD